MTIEKLLPQRVATSMKGSGISPRELAAPGTRHHLDLATLQMRVTPAIAVRGGLGVAHQLPRGFLPGDSGVAMTGGATYTVWQGEDVQLDVDLNAVHAGYDGSALSDTTILLALRNR